MELKKLAQKRTRRNLKRKRIHAARLNARNSWCGGDSTPDVFLGNLPFMAGLLAAAHEACREKHAHSAAMRKDYNQGYR